jgi:sialate O-acetylesterase
MAELLLGLRPRGRFSPENTGIIHIRQEDDGRSELLLLNDKPPSFFDRFILTDGPGPEIPGFVNLAGTWKIRAGDADEGEWLDTVVPGGWEKDALPAYDGIAWYRHDFVVSEETRATWGQREVVLVMGGIDDADETFLNGRKIGASGVFPPDQVSAYNQPRRYAFPVGLLQLTNLLTIRVSDWMGGGGLWRAPVLIGPADGLPVSPGR